MRAPVRPEDADPITTSLRRFVAGLGVPERSVVDVGPWAAVRRVGIAAPGLRFAGWAGASVLGGLVAPVLANCPDVATMLVDLERFHPLFDLDRIVVTPAAATTSISLQATDGGAADPDAVDACFALVCQVAARVSGTVITPVLVTLRRPAPADPQPYVDVFGTVAFGRREDRCTFGTQALAAPLTHADPVVRSMLRGYADQRLERRGSPWTTAVRELLAEGAVPLADVARSLTVSTRTLQARLAGEGHSFAGLVDDAQREATTRLLATTDLSVTQVAARTGFATPSALARAVRRWTGTTPTGYRAAPPDGRTAGTGAAWG